MAATKRNAVGVAAVKNETPKTGTEKGIDKTVEAAKTETTKKTEAEAAKKETVKKETVKKETAKKAPAKKTTVKEAELKSEVHIQFGGKSYSQEDLIKIAKDVWRYDLKQKASELSSVELYVKPEESMVYYVMNKDVTGSFYI